MGTALTGTEIKDTYDSLIKVTDNGPISGTAKYLSDGLGNDSALALSTGNIGIGTNSPAAKLDIVGAAGNTQLNITSGSGTFPFITLDQTGVVKYAIQNTATTGLFTITEAGVANRLVIEKTSGNVGIGTDSPEQLLTVAGGNLTVSGNTGTARQVLLLTTASTVATIESTYQGISSFGDLAFKTSSTERMRITSAGNVGIGTSSPSATLSIAGTLSVSSTITGTQGNFALGTVGGSIGSVKNLTITNTNGAIGDFAGLNFAYYNNSTNFGYIGSVLTSSTTNSASDLVFGVKASTSAVDVTEYMRIKAGGKVGINTTSALGQLNIKNESAGATTNALALYNTPSNTENTGVAIEFYPNVGVNDRCARISAVNPSTSGQNVADLRFFTSNDAAPTEKLRILASGGITFNGDTAAANALDDYEEGTWSPVISDGTNDATMVAGAGGQYTKIGRQVTLTGYCRTTSIGSVSGNIRIKNLPFTAGGNEQGGASLTFGFFESLSLTAGHSVGGYIEGGLNYIILTVNDAAAGTTMMQATEWGNNGFIFISFTYFV